MRRLAGWLWRASVCVVALYLVAGLMWRYSGSNRWEFVAERDGVKVYTLKEPGSDVRLVKGVARVRATLARLVKMIRDPRLCEDIGCTESYSLDRVDDQLEYYTFRANLPFPFKPREYVIRTKFSQVARTQEVLMDVAAAPDKIPPNPCCFRVTHMNNTMHFTPLGNGEIEIEYVIDMNEGGFLPPLVLNLARTRVMFVGMHKMQEFVDKPQYQQARYDFIQE